MWFVTLKYLENPCGNLFRKGVILRGNVETLHAFFKEDQIIQLKITLCDRPSTWLFLSCKLFIGQESS